MQPNPIQIALVDDHTLFRKTLTHFLSEQNNIRVAIQAADIPDLLSKLGHTRVDILLMDIFMPKIGGNEALKLIRQEFPALKIVILSMSTDISLICDLLDTGIHGFISKTDDPEHLLHAIVSVSDGRIYRNKLLTEALYWTRQSSIKSHMAGNIPFLNEREKRIVQLIWEEKSNKEIADELFLGIRSVEKIRQDMKEKTGARSTVGLLKYAIGKQIINVSDRLVGIAQ